MGKVGKKRADRRWKAPNGQIWSSEFEFRVYEGLAESLGRGRVHKCEQGESDTFNYSSSTVKGTCLECGSKRVVQQRTYTPDIRITGIQSENNGPVLRYIETKGYFKPKQRGLLRSFLKTGPSVDLCIILQQERKATQKLKLTEYIAKYMKIPVFVWDAAQSSKKPENRVFPSKVPKEIIKFLGCEHRRICQDAVPLGLPPGDVRCYDCGIEVPENTGWDF
jgi:DNA-directed RNA polymerase subunit RPC12/RpoP